jgi:hypothetical protein
MRRAEPDERRHYMHSAGIGNAFGESFGLSGRTDQAKFVAQPLNHRACDKHAALHRELRLGTDSCGPRAQQTMRRTGTPTACMGERETSRSVGVLR